MQASDRGIDEEKGFVGDRKGSSYGTLSEVPEDKKGTLTQGLLPEVSSFFVIVGMVSVVFAANSGMAIAKMIEHAESEGKLNPLVLVVSMHLVMVGVSFFAFTKVRPAWQFSAENPPAKAESKDYDPRWDNLKFYLTQVVAQAHFIQWGFHRKTYHVPAEVLRCCQEWFVMQTYVFMSGYLAVPTHTNARLQAAWKSIAICYIINQLLYMVYVEPHSLNLLGVLTPWSVMWYLMSLVEWRLLAPMWMQLRYPLSFAILVAMVQGYSMLPRAFALDWTFAFLPYYVVGIEIRRQQHAFKAALQWPGVRTGSILSFGAMFICVLVNNMQYCGGSTQCLYLETQIDPKDLYTAPFYTFSELQWQLSFQAMAQGNGFYFLWYGRLASFPAHCLMVFSVVALLANTRNICLDFVCFTFDVTKRGSRSLCNYVLHYWTIFILAPIYASGGEFSFRRLAAALALPCIIANILMWEPVYELIRPVLLSPPSSWLLAPADSK